MHPHRYLPWLFAFGLCACSGDDGAGAAPDGGGAVGGANSGGGGTFAGSGGTTGGASGGGGSGGGGGTGTTGSSDAGTNAGKPPPGRDGEAVAQIASDFAEAYCGLAARCFPPAFLNMNLGGEQCVMQLRAGVEDKDLLELQASVDAGRVIYDPDKAQACFAMLGTIACSAEASGAFDEGDCAEMLAGTVPAGGECGLDEECKGDTFCDKASGCPGTCVAQLAQGKACSDDEQCLGSLDCDGDTGTCETDGEDGDRCGGGVAPDCGLGLMCVGDDADTMQTGACKPFDEVFVGEADDVCDFDTGLLCQDDLTCVVTITGTGPGAMANFACESPVAADAPCNFGVPSPCPSGQFCKGLDLAGGDVEGVCTDFPSDGEPCGREYGASCASGFVCDADRLCHPIGRIGDPCVSDRGCASERCAQGTCQRPPKCVVR